MRTFSFRIIWPKASIWSGPPSDGQRILTSTGNDGNWVSHFWNAAGGLLLISPNDAPPSASFPSTTIYLTGICYAGSNGGNGGGDCCPPEYNIVYKGTQIKIGDKFSNFGGISSTTNHVGKYPLDIFDGNWSRLGDNRTFKFIGNDLEKLTRLLPSYTQVTNQILVDNLPYFASTGEDSFNNCIYTSLVEDDGNYTPTGGWTADGSTRNRFYFNIGDPVSIDGLFYVNGLGNSGIKRCIVYGSVVEPSQVVGDTTGLSQLFTGTFNERGDGDVSSSVKKFITFPTEFTAYSWVCVDVFSNYGNSLETKLQVLEVFKGVLGISTTPPATGDFVKYVPVWGDNGNGQGLVTLNKSSGGHGPTEWAYSEAADYNTLHIRNRDALTDSVGELILFENNPIKRSYRDIGLHTDEDSLEDSRRVLIKTDTPIVSINVGSFNGSDVLPRIFVKSNVNIFKIIVYDTNGYRTATETFNIYNAEDTTSILVPLTNIVLPFADTGSILTFMRNPFNAETWIRTE